MKGHYGIYGGQYIAETLMTPINELEAAYEDAKRDPAFQREFEDILKNYASGWQGVAGVPFWRFTLNSVIVTVVSVVGTIFCSLLAAYAVSRLKFKGANFWFGCIVMTMMIPSQVMVVPQYIILKKLGLSDTLVSMTLP